MSGEQTAKFYEALTAYAIEQAIRRTPFRNHSVDREIELPGVNIRSDVVLRTQEGAVEAVFLVTHSGIAVHWAEKFKRDSAEFIELATSDLPIKMIYLVLFDGRTLPGLEAIASSFLTGLVRVTDVDPTGVIQRYGHDAKVLNKLSAAETDTATQLLDDLLKKDTALRRAVTAFTMALLGALKNGSTRRGHSDFFTLTKTMASTRRKTFKQREPRHTRFNRALSKLALVPPDIVQAIQRGQSFTGPYDWATLPIFWQNATRTKGSMFGPAIGHKFRCTDPEIIGGRVGGERSGYDVESIFGLLSVAQILSVIKAGSQDMLPRYAARVHATDVNHAAANYVIKSIKSLQDKKTLGRLFREVFNSPHDTFVKRCRLTPSIKVEWHWLYTAIVSLMKAHEKKKQGFGYSKIAARMSTPRFRSAVEHSILQHFEYRLRQLPDALIEEVAQAIASYLADADLDHDPDLALEATKYLVWSEVEDKVIPHAVDVLPAMIQMAAKRHGMQLEKGVMTSCLANSIESQGTSGRTNVYRSNNTVIWYKAGHFRQNILHKRHEMQSVIAGWMQDWDATLGTFSSTKRMRKLIVVLDGDWLEEDMELLHAFGCDAFLYPDELDRLPDMIV